MKQIGTELIMLGTGAAIATRCYNTCFVVRNGSSLLLVDAGGGNGILSRLEKAGIGFDRLHDLFVTHAHTDHILGAVWTVRMAIHRFKEGACPGVLRVYGHDRVLQVLEQICRLTLPASDTVFIGEKVFFLEVRDSEYFSVGDMRFRCFDIFSAKEKQFGFRASLPNGKSLVCLGDEPYNERNRSHAENADWLMSEAFCLYRDRERFRPYEKHHSTALEAAATAQRLNARNLLLYHTEDRTLETRKPDYTAEASLRFTGNVYVPDDLETVPVE